MNINDLKQAGSLIKKYGVKAILYGQPGTGKTPLINTAPGPVILATEPGLLSMKGSQVPTWEAFTIEKIGEFFKWFTESKEAANFDTLAIDSGSQLAEISLNYHLERNKDGRKAYGELSIEVMKWFDSLYYMPQKHILLICKQMSAEVGKQVMKQAGAFVVEMVYQAQPYFPGKDLNIKIPHRYDEILHISKVSIPGMVEPQMAIRSKGTAEILARDRSGMLAELEPLNLTNLFNKCMS